MAQIVAVELGAVYDPGVGGADFTIDSNGILQPLGLLVSRDSREDLLPRTREYNEEIPGRHGELDFGSEFQPRILELHVSTAEIDPATRYTLKRTLAGQLNPLAGVKTLVFEDDPTRMYYVKYAGDMRINTQWPTWFDFVIPFKMANPFIFSANEHSFTGSGTITNAGNVDVPFNVYVYGPAVNPIISINGEVMTWTGNLVAGDILVIDTGNQTVRLNDINALGTYNGVFPVLRAGSNDIVVSHPDTVFKWWDRWI
ncbi:MAG: phage tail family protein [Peptococcaceae bacterium]|nr:MAG: phage tail family protein [Peptococcaceae bacterium]